MLTIRGLDDDGVEVAKVTLRTGQVYYAKVWNEGTEMKFINPNGAIQTEPSPDRERHQVSEPVDPLLASFVRLEAVAAEMEPGLRIVHRHEQHLHLHRLPQRRRRPPDRVHRALVDGVSQPCRRVPG